MVRQIGQITSFTLIFLFSNLFTFARLEAMFYLLFVLFLTFDVRKKKSLAKCQNLKTVNCENDVFPAAGYIYRNMFKSGAINFYYNLRGLFSGEMEGLQKEDFCFSPISIDLIEPNLYLGGLSAAKDVNTLVRYKITHILTIDTCPLPRKILDLKNITTKYIQLSDQPKEDLLSHFEDAEAFILEGMSQGAVLVHCYFGVSRSATIVIAYIMKKYQLTYREAFAKVKAKRSIVYPNQGFVAQLLLYKEMGYKIDPTNMKYKIFRLNIAADQVRKVKILPQNFMDLIKFDPGLTQTHPEPNVYRCKKCRRVLASESNLITHKIEGEICTKTYFIEPLAWMNVTQNIQDKLYCPKCNSKVGSFSWIMGCQCPCGVKVAPAFYLTPSKVDFTNVVKNVEMTF